MPRAFQFDWLYGIDAFTDITFLRCYSKHSEGFYRAMWETIRRGESWHRELLIVA